MSRMEINAPLNLPRQQPSISSRANTNVTNVGVSTIAKNSNPVKDSLVKLTSPRGFGRDSHNDQSKSTITRSTTNKDTVGRDENKSTTSRHTTNNQSPTKDSSATLYMPQDPGSNSYDQRGKSMSATSSSPTTSQNTTGNDGMKTSMKTSTSLQTTKNTSKSSTADKNTTGSDGFKTSTSFQTTKNSSRVNDSLVALMTPHVLERDSPNKKGKSATSFMTQKTPPSTSKEGTTSRNAQISFEKVQEKKTFGQSSTSHATRPEQNKSTAGPRDRNMTFTKTLSTKFEYPEQRGITGHSHGESETENSPRPTRKGYSEGQLNTVTSKTAAISNEHKSPVKETNPTHTILPEKQKAEYSPKPHMKAVCSTPMEYSSRPEPLTVSTTPSAGFIPTIERRTSANSTTSLSTISAVSVSSKPDPDGEYGSQLRKQASNQNEVPSFNNIRSTPQYSAHDDGAKYDMSTTRESPTFNSPSHVNQGAVLGSGHGSPFLSSSRKNQDPTAGSTDGPTYEHEKTTMQPTYGSSSDKNQSQIRGSTHGSAHTHEKAAGLPKPTSFTHRSQSPVAESAHDSAYMKDTFTKSATLRSSIGTQSTVLGSMHGSTHSYDTAETAFTVPGPASLTDIELALFYAQSLDSRDIDAIKALAHPHCDTQFAEINMKMTDFLNEFSRVFKAFPDLNFSWKNIKQVEPGVVEIGFFQVSGTHTGDSWGFEPFPAVAAEGRRVKTDPERIVFETEGGKFKKITYIASSDQSGLPGIYRQIGGFPM